MLNIIIFGAPGSGKGTQSTMIAERYNLEHISTGEMLRREIREGTALGCMVKETLSRGELVADDIVTNMIASVIDGDTTHRGFLYDGYPRTVTQASQLAGMLKARGMDVDVLLLMEVDHEELLSRLAGRGIEGGRPEDKSVEIIKNRLDIYRQMTEPVVDYYCETKACVPINGMGTVDEIFSRIVRTIEMKCKV